MSPSTRAIVSIRIGVGGLVPSPVSRDDTRRANSRSRMRHRAVPDGSLPLVPASNKTRHLAVSEAPGRDLAYPWRQAASLTPGVFGRESGPAHDRAVCSYYSQALAATIAPSFATSTGLGTSASTFEATTCNCRTRVKPTSGSSFARHVPYCRKAGLTTSVSVDTPLWYRAIFQDGACPTSACASTMS